MIRNHDLELPPDVQATFRRGQATKIALLPGRELFKFTSHSLINSRNSEQPISPWWSAVEPIAKADLGLDGTLQRARQTNSLPQAFMRARASVAYPWNDMEGLLCAALRKPVYAFYGQCSGLRTDGELPSKVSAEDRKHQVLFIGGTWQLWIPNLAIGEIEEVDSAGVLKRYGLKLKK